MAYRFANENGLQINQVKLFSESIKRIISAALLDRRVDGICNIYIYIRSSQTLNPE